MRYFFKLFLSVVLLLTVALAAVEYFSVALSLDHAFERELSSELTQHQMVKFTIQTSLLSAEENGAATSAQLGSIAESAYSPLSTEGRLLLADASGEVYFSNLRSDSALGDVDAKAVSYKVISGSGDDVRLRIESRFTQSGRSLALITEQDISAIFIEAEALQAQCTKLYFIVLAIGAFAALLLSWLLTRPLAALRSVSRDFALGNYQARSKIQTRDEIGAGL